MSDTEAQYFRQFYEDDVVDIKDEDALYNVVTMKTRGALMRTENLWYDGHNSLHTVKDMNRMFMEHGCEAWKHFLEYKQVGIKTTMEVLELLRSRRDLPAFLISQFEEIAKLYGYFSY